MKKKILVRGPVLSQSGYGEQSRFALRALRSKSHLFDIFIQPISWGQTGWIWKDDEFRTWMDERIVLTQVLAHKRQLHCDISLQITIPNEFEKLCGVNYGYTAGIETTKVAPQWIQRANEKVDRVLVVSNHAKSTLENTVRPEPEEIPGFNLKTDFNFLIVSQMGPRKNFNDTIQWWVEEFVDQEVGLVIKTNIRNNCKMDLEATYETLRLILSKYPDRKCKVYLLHGDLSSGQMTSLYTNEKIKAIVNIAHGEGFGLPLFEASRESLPIITIGWSGQQDFLHHDKKEYFQSVDYELKNIQKDAVWPGVLEAQSNWAYADQGSYKMSLRKVYKNWEESKSLAEELKKINDEKFSDEVLYKRFCSFFYDEEKNKEIEKEIDSLLEDLL